MTSEIMEYFSKPIVRKNSVVYADLANFKEKYNKSNRTKEELMKNEVIQYFSKYWAKE